MMNYITTVLTDPESAIVLDEFYNRAHGIADDSEEYNTFGIIGYHNQEDTSAFNSYSDLLDVYLKYDIKKFFGITIDEFLDRTRFSRNILIEKAEQKMREISAELEKAGANTVKEFDKLTPND